jgi:hypothetical protein
MKLFLIFIPLILIYSKDIRIIDKEPIIETEEIEDPPAPVPVPEPEPEPEPELYSDRVKFRFENMWFSCHVTPIHNQCKLDVNSFFQIVLNSTDDYSSHANYVYSLINYKGYRFLNDNTRKQLILKNIIKYIIKIKKRRPTKAISDNLWNTGCRCLVSIFGLNGNLCD